MKFLPALIIIMLSGCHATDLMAQEHLQPVVHERFGKIFLSDNFDSLSSRWSVQSTSDNLMLVQDGEMILQRRAVSNPYAVMGHFDNTLMNYRMVTSVKLKKSSDDGSIGVIFMAQPGGQGGFIFEINSKQQYRLRQLKGTMYRYLSGEAKTGGWVKNEWVKGNGLANLVDIRTSEKQYDLYLNEKLLQSFTEITYKYGDFGYLIGPASKGSVDFLYLFTDEAGQTAEANTLNHTEPENDVAALAESVISLKTQLNKLSEENEELRQVIASLKVDSKDKEHEEEELKNAIVQLQNQLKQTQSSYDSLLKVNSELVKYKELVKGNDNGDLVINLSRNLKNEKIKNEELQKELNTLRDSTHIKNEVTIPVSKDKKESATREFTLPNEDKP